MEPILVIKSAIKANVPILLEGHTGTGKTYTIMQLAEESRKTLHVINVSGELTVDSILGQQILLDGNIVWRDGVLTTAMKQGDWVLFDELNTALPEVLTVVNGVLDDSHSITLPNADNERVSAHEGFRFIGTQNPSTGKYVGANRLNDALLNRMIKVQFDYMSPEKEIHALQSHTKMAGASVRALVDIARYTRQEDFDSPISTRDLVKILRMRDGGGFSIRDAISVVLLQKYSQREYRNIYGRFSDRLREYKSFTGYTDKDPMDFIREENDKLTVMREEFAQQKLDIRAAVKRELLNDLLNDSGSSVIPEGL